MKMGKHREFAFVFVIACGLLAMLSCAPPAARAAEEVAEEGEAAAEEALVPTTAEATIAVSPDQWGVSTRYIGGTEGDSRFDIDDLTDCGLNTLRIYGDMSRLEPTDDDGEYGSPTIAQVKADPHVRRPLLPPYHR
jgi:hypothetical protein